MINFVSHLPLNLRSGGFSAMNAAALSAIEGLHRVNYAAPIPLRSDFDQKAMSKLLRMGGMPGSFHQYSRRRLSANADAVERACDPKARLDFFHGFTPWAATRPIRPYVAWSDCTFRDYIDIYHRRGQFVGTDLARIEAMEANWLRGARGIAFTSEWAARRAIRHCALDPARVSVVGVFGEMDPPDEDEFNGGAQFAFISTNFVAKGGPVVMNAFERLRVEYPHACLLIVGDSPPGLDGPGVRRTGFLRKEVPGEYAELRDILARSRAVVHPTLSDIAPLLAVEAFYFGCPVISSKRFAIPEIVEHGCTGLLVEDPADSAQVLAAMKCMLSEDKIYLAMRRAAWKKGRRDHLKRRFEERLRGFVEAAMQGA